MAGAQLSLTRRALLAGACVAPLLGAGAPPSSSRRRPGSPGDPLGALSRRDPGLRRDDEGRWREALARFRASEEALAAVAHTEDDRLYDRALGRFNTALKRLLRTAAPGPAALALKLDLLVHHQFWEITGAGSCLAAMRRDAHRLAASSA